MSTAGSICMPTPCGAELLMRILNLYPILSSILSFSHRSSIINLSKTCHTIYAELTTSLAMLQNPYPRCTRDLENCSVCHTPVCGDCKVERREMETPTETMLFYGFEYALVGGRTPTARLEIVTKLQAVLPLRRDRFSVVEQLIKHCVLCEVCSLRTVFVGKAVAEVPPDWYPANLYPIQHRLGRYTSFPLLRWADVLHGDTGGACTCPMTDNECAAPLHLVTAERVPINSELIGFPVGHRDLPVNISSKLPPRFPHTVTRVHDVRALQEVYILPFYVQD